MTKLYKIKIYLAQGIILMFAVSAYSQGVGIAWVVDYNGPGNSYDKALALTVDDSGNVYITGISYDSISDYDYATIKYFPNGDTAWVRRYNGPANSWDEAYALAVDDSGNVYVTGYSFGSDQDYLTIKYKSDGDTAWVRRHNGSTGYVARDIEIDDSGNVYVTGGVWDMTFPPYFDIATIKYTPDGDTHWVRIYDSQVAYSEFGSFPFYRLGVDDSGNAYVSGKSDEDYFTVKYAPNGDTVWVRRYSGVATAIVVDDSANVYVTGSPSTVKYASNGDTVWVRPTTSVIATAIVVDDSGNVYVTGPSFSIIKYSPNGDTVWTTLYNKSEASSLAVDDSYNVYVTGLGYTTIKYSPCSATPGDVNGTPPISLPDVIHLVNYIFDKDRPATGCLGSDPGNCWTPGPLCRGEINGISPIGLPDVIHLVNYVFDKDRPATSCLGSSPGNCWNPVPTGVCCLPVQ